MSEKPKSFGKELITMAKQTTIRIFFLFLRIGFWSICILLKIKIFTEKTKNDGCRNIAADPFKIAMPRKAVDTPQVSNFAKS